VTLPECLELLAARVRAIDGLTVSTDPQATVVPGLVVIADAGLDYNYTMRGGATVNFTATAYVSRSDVPSGVFEVRDYLSPYGTRSIRAALDTPVDGDAIDSLAHVDSGRSGVDQTSGYIVAVFTGTVRIAADI
jgi:hypothetical protein